MTNRNPETITIDGEEFTIEESDYNDPRHPIAAMFDIEDVRESTTPIAVIDDNQELVVAAQYDDKDVDIDQELNHIKNIALATFEEQKQLSSQVEPKFKADILASANGLLTTALQAIKEKADMKKAKDKLTKNPGLKIGNSEVTNVIVADRNELLRQRKNQP